MARYRIILTLSLLVAVATAGSLLSLRIPGGGRRLFSCFVKTANGKTVTVNTSAYALVYDVKLQVQAKTGIPPYEQRLIFGGRQLEDGHGVMALGVSAHSTLHLSLRLCGGAAVTGLQGILNEKKDPFDDGKCGPEWSDRLVLEVLDSRRAIYDPFETIEDDILGDKAVVRMALRSAEMANCLPGNITRFREDIFQGKVGWFVVY